MCVHLFKRKCTRAASKNRVFRGMETTGDACSPQEKHSLEQWICDLASAFGQQTGKVRAYAYVRMRELACVVMMIEVCCASVCCALHRSALSHLKFQEVHDQHTRTVTDARLAKMKLEGIYDYAKLKRTFAIYQTAFYLKKNPLNPFINQKDQKRRSRCFEHATSNAQQ